VSQGLAGVRKAAKENKELQFTTLLHHLNSDLLRVSFQALVSGLPVEAGFASVEKERDARGGRCDMARV
jgi:hypothetical protein